MHRSCTLDKLFFVKDPIFLNYPIYLVRTCKIVFRARKSLSINKLEDLPVVLKGRKRHQSTTYFSKTYYYMLNSLKLCILGRAMER